MKRILMLGISMAIAVVILSGTALGSPLNVVGGASPINAAPGNSNSAALVISVTDQNGNAVSGLIPSNFKVDVTIAAPGGALVDITRADEAARAPGFYIVEVVPTTYQGTQYTWKAGVYLFSVTVDRGAYRGQTVVPLDLCNICTVAGAGRVSDVVGVRAPDLTLPSAEVVGTLTPAARLPDLIVTEVVPGTPSFEEDGRAANLPLKVTIKNVGGATDKDFKTSVDVIVGSGARYVRPFSVPGQTDIWYPWKEGLGAGEEATFTGNLNIRVPLGEVLYNQEAKIMVFVDSCSGDEFMPDYCRVQETNEINNEKEVSVRLTQMIQAIRGPQLQPVLTIPTAKVV
ncbi:MAG: hypothetical protein WBK88_02320 [Methanothrix sp.]